MMMETARRPLRLMGMVRWPKATGTARRPLWAKARRLQPVTATATLPVMTATARRPLRLMGTVHWSKAMAWPQPETALQLQPAMDCLPATVPVPERPSLSERALLPERPRMPVTAPRRLEKAPWPSSQPAMATTMMRAMVPRIRWLAKVIQSERAPE